MQHDASNNPTIAGRIGPFRTEVRRCSVEEIRRLNEAAERTGVSAWVEDVEGEIARIDELRGSSAAECAPAQIQTWATHPDERVRLALLGSRLIWTDARKEIGRLAMETDAAHRAPGEHWNPTIDKVAGAPFETWPIEGEYIRRDSALAYPPGQGPAAWVRGRVASDLRTTPLPPEQAREILARFHYQDVVRAVLDTVKPDVAFVEWLGEQRPGLVTELAGRNGLGGDVDRALWDAALAMLAGNSSAGRPSAVINQLRIRGSVPEDAIEQLLDVGESLRFVTWDFAIALQGFMSFSGADGFTADTLKRFYRMVRRDKQAVRSIIGHPAATPELRAHIVLDTSFDTIRREIARRYGDTPHVRKVLGRSTSKKVLLQLAQHAEGEELIDVLDRLAKKYPGEALDLLRRLSKSSEIDLPNRKAMTERYYDRLVDVDPSRALTLSDVVLQDLGEKELRASWTRRIGRGLTVRAPERLSWLGGAGLALLEREDWEPLLTCDMASDELVRILRSIPDARLDRDARRLVFERGSARHVKAQIESLLPGEERTAALAVLRVCVWEFDTVLEEYPALKASLTPEDLLPLLDNASSHTRQKAILLLGDVQKASMPTPALETGERRDPSR